MSAATIHLVCPNCATVNRIPEVRLDHAPRCGVCKSALMAASPVALNDASFSKFIERTELPVLVDFWAQWCGPCKAMAPQFEMAAARLPRVRFAKIDTEANPQVSARYGIRSIPTLVLFRSGRETARHMGAIGASELLQWLQQQSRLG